MSQYIVFLGEDFTPLEIHTPLPGLPGWYVFTNPVADSPTGQGQRLPFVRMEELEAFLRQRSLELGQQFSGPRWGPGSPSYALQDPEADAAFRRNNRDRGSAP